MKNLRFILAGLSIFLLMAARSAPIHQFNSVRSTDHNPTFSKLFFSDAGPASSTDASDGKILLVEEEKDDDDESVKKKTTLLIAQLFCEFYFIGIQDHSQLISSEYKTSLQFPIYKRNRVFLI